MKHFSQTMSCWMNSRLISGPFSHRFSSLSMTFLASVLGIDLCKFVHYDPPKSRMSVYMTCFVLKSEILTPPTPGYVSITVSANGKTLKFEHARYWPLSKLSENCSLSEPQMYQNTTQKHPQNGPNREIMENRF